MSVCGGGGGGGGDKEKFRASVVSFEEIHVEGLLVRVAL